MILRRENCVILWISVKLKYLNIYKNFKYLNVTWPTKVGELEWHHQGRGDTFRILLHIYVGIFHENW